MIILSIGLIGYGSFLKIKENERIKLEERKQKLAREEQERKEKQLQEVKDSYNPFVMTTSEVDLYEAHDDKYTIVGKLSTNYKLELGEIDITYDTQYFPLEVINILLFILFVFLLLRIENRIKLVGHLKHFVPKWLLCPVRCHEERQPFFKAQKIVWQIEWCVFYFCIVINLAFTLKRFIEYSVYLSA